MKGSLTILSFFALGVCLGIYECLPDFLLATDWSSNVLMVLMLLVGFSLGANNEVLKIFKSISWKIVLVPLSTIVGTFIGVSLVAAFIKEISALDALAVGSGFAYYSLSSILITEVKGDALGVIALLANISRELITLVLAPLMVRYFGKLAPIVSGGATTIDTTLPIITQVSGQAFVVIALFHGIVLEVSVPILVSFFISL